jgi:hypothetical protein
MTYFEGRKISPLRRAFFRKTEKKIETSQNKEKCL